MAGQTYRATLKELYFGSTQNAVRFRYALLGFDLLTIAFFIASSMAEQTTAILVADLVLAAVLAGEFAARLSIANRPWLHLVRFQSIADIAVIGSLLAIPVGLGSAYSIYRANFSVETTCQSLRADIISMIDKRVDAGTRRILARRDVEKFEQSCGAIDPDATAAFKTLLANDKPATAAAAPVAAPVPAAPAKDVARKVEPHPRTAGKMPDAAWPGTERAHRDWVCENPSALMRGFRTSTRAEAQTGDDACAHDYAPRPGTRTYTSNEALFHHASRNSSS